jgi:hypothetical protein
MGDSNSGVVLGSRLLDTGFNLSAVYALDRSVSDFFSLCDGACYQLARQFLLVHWCARRRSVLPNVNFGSEVGGGACYGSGRLAGFGW